MSAGSIFSLILRDARFDDFFTATDLLRRRLDEIRKRRAQTKREMEMRGDSGAQAFNVQPLFTDIEKTHIIYTHGGYRPFVSVASEYTKVKCAGASAGALLDAPGSLQFTFLPSWHWTSDIVLAIKISAIGNAAAQASGATPTVTTPLLRYCGYPGLRLPAKVSLNSGSIPIDEYVSQEAVAYSKCFVDTDHRAGWDRCHGQQELRTASYAANGIYRKSGLRGRPADS